MNTAIRTTLVCSAIFCYSAPAFAQSTSPSVGCVDINGFSSSRVEVRIFRELTGNPLAEGEVITLTASSVTSTEPVGTPVWAFADTSMSFGLAFGVGAFSPTFPSSSLPISETVTVPTGGIDTFGLTEFGGWVTDLNDVTITCFLAAPPISAAVFDLAEISTAHQNQSLRFALDRNIRSRIGDDSSSEPVVTRSNFFMSTDGMNDDTKSINAWVTASGRAFFDGYDGYSTDVIAGADWLLGNSGVFGVMAGVGMTDIDDSTVSKAETSSYLVGLYGGHGFSSNVQIDGYLAYSGVDYDVDTTSFDTDRWLAGLAISDQVAIASGILEHRARVFGAWEDFPADVGGIPGGTTEQYRFSVGVRHEWNAILPGTYMRPWASLDLEYGRQEDTNNLQSDFVAPRLGVGVSGTVGSGSLSASLDVGRTTSDVVDSGLEFSYSLSF